MIKSGTNRSSVLRLHLADSNAKLCGLCHTKHAPNEPHKFKAIKGQKSPTQLLAEQESQAALKAVIETAEPSEKEKELPPGYKENRTIGLGRAPGIDLHSIYNAHKPRAIRPKKMKKVQKPVSEFEKAISEFKETIAPPILNEPSAIELPRPLTVSTVKPLPPLIYQSINGIDLSLQDAGAEIDNNQLVCTERELPDSVEDEIKDGFFELKQKFRDQGPSSIYISHIVLHQKHPIFSKIEINIVKRFLTESSVVYLNKD